MQGGGGIGGMGEGRSFGVMNVKWVRNILVVQGDAGRTN